MTMMMIEKKSAHSQTTEQPIHNAEKRKKSTVCSDEDMHKIPATELFMHAIFIILWLCECLLGVVAAAVGVIKYVCAVSVYDFSLLFNFSLCTYDSNAHFV